MRTFSLVVAALLCLAPAAYAEDEAEEGEVPSLASGDNKVELPILVAPVTVDGKLYHYAYMRIILDTSSGGVVPKAYEKVPFIIDAMLRETHRASIALNGDPEEIDGEGLKKRLLDVANTVMGAGSFVSLSFRDTIQTDGESSLQQEQEAANAAPVAVPPEASPAHH